MTTGRRRRRPWASLSGRVALGAVGGLIVAAVLFAAIAVSLIRSEATSQARAELNRQAQAVATIVSDRVATALATGQEFRTEPIGNFEALAGPRTRLYYVGLALSPGAIDPTGGLPETVAREIDPDTLVRDGSQGFDFTPSGGTMPTFAAAAPVSVGRRYIGAIVLTRPQAEVSASWGEILAPVLVAVAFGLIVAVILVMWVTRRATRPLRDLGAAAGRVAVGDLATEVPETSGPEELDAVARSFNAMVRQLARRDRIAREFLMRITHDLRTPLTAIRGHASALGDGVVPEDAVPRSLGAIVSEANRLEVLVTDLLDLARMDADRFRIHPVAVPGAEPVRLATDALSSQANAKGVALITDIAEVPPIVTDPDRVQQIIGNLLDNAIRWTPPGGTITVTVRAGTAGGTITEVSDTGPGLTPELLEIAFEPFLSSETPDGHSGSGLGLAIAKQLARALGGDLRACDAIRHGARFILTLPAEVRNDEGPPPPRDEGPSFTSSHPGD
ncbi:MAG: HAMP domain-containing histidine kinase [Thermoleophilia bacterium]|nr:HAMP domain-containing histidine kinase [Thermoleophilia bacterium]